MKTAFPFTFHLILTTIQFLDKVTAQRPPHLLPNTGDQQRIVAPESTVTLPCPVHGDKNHLIFDWYKDKEAVVALGGHRHRITGSGALRIKDVTVDDTGIYTCRAVNGFGSVEQNITLLVIDEDEEYEYENEPIFWEDAAMDKEDYGTHKINFTTKPHLLYVTEWDKTQYHQFPGSSLRFLCVATGHPKPRVTWSRNEGQELPRNAKRGRWSLRLQNIRELDSGNYTCSANNILGTTSHSFFIDVSTFPEITREKPQLTGPHPANTTVEEGQMAMFQCMMRSAETPHIEWLKRVEEYELDEDNFRDFINMDNEHFRVIKSSDVVDKADGSFWNKLVIREAHNSDSGKYICFGANSNGFSYRSAYLSVLPSPYPTSVSISESDSLPFPIVVAVIVVGMATIAGGVALVVYCRKRQNGGTSSQDNSTGTPMVTKEIFLPMHRYPPSTRTCDRDVYESSRNRPHHVSVYVPVCPRTGGERTLQPTFGR